MESVSSSAGEVIARIAYLLSDVVISVQPALRIETDFSKSLQQLVGEKAHGLVAKGLPDILFIRQNDDPLLSAFEPINSGRLVSVTTNSAILLPSIPHLYKLAQFPVVIHVSLSCSQSIDYSDISSIRQCGFTFLESETLQEAQDLALSAHALAIKTGKGVIHFFDPGNLSLDDPIVNESQDLIQKVVDWESVKESHTLKESQASLYADDGRLATITETAPSHNRGASIPPTAPNDISVQTTASHQSSSVGSSVRESSTDSRQTLSSATSVESTTTRPISSEDIYHSLLKIWAVISSETNRKYNAFKYTGPEDAQAALFIFGSTGVFVDQLEADAPDDLKNLGIITARLYRPWLASELLKEIPGTIKRIAVLEQLRTKTTKWGPVLLDLLSTVNSRSTPGDKILIVGFQLEHVESATALQALRGIYQNLHSPSPLQNLTVGRSKPFKQGQKTSLEKPKVEGAYWKILTQVFGEHLYVANRLGANDAGISSTIAASPEYGFGSLLARIERKQKFMKEIQEAAKTPDFATDIPRNWLSKWSLIAEDSAKASSLAPDVIARLAVDGSKLANQLLSSKEFFFDESRWLIGSDAWAYDLGNSGVHHVLASDADINMLIIDTQPYSERAAKDSPRRKKDIGLYAMNFGNAYVASVAVYGSYTQVLEAMIEADRFKGPSVVLAYLPYNKEDDSPLTVLRETKNAVDAGYWPLYRWNPNNEDKGEPNFSLDSPRIRQELEGFLRRDNQLSQLMRRHPNFSNSLSESYGSEVRALQKRKAKNAYGKLLEGLFGAPLTILYASDNGNAENLAKRLCNRGKNRGLKTMAMAMDDYPIEDLPAEENVVIITSTAGQGEFPQNGRSFWETIKGSGDIELSSVHFAVFGLGDSHYWPRKQDKIFYNKPAKDLDARIAFLGAKKLADVGLGDDQDPDGYQTGYGEWEPKLWHALGVDNVEGLPEEPAPLTNEDIKAQSNFLRGTIVEGLNDETTGAISASDSQLTKFHGTYMEDDRDLRDERKAQGLEPAYAFMIRCRVPGGVATPSQWLQMDAISSAHGNETMKLTTRQTFQFHGIIKGKLRGAMRAINRALMTTLAACGDVNRNVMCSTMPERSAYHRDVYEVSKKIDQHLLPNTTAYHEIWLRDENNKKVKVAGDAIVDQEPLYGPTYLPRKFKVTIAVPPYNDTDVFAHCVGLIAIKGANGRLDGFNVLAGGGMGVTHNNKKTFPRTGSMLGYVSTSNIVLVCEKIMLIQRDHGDRKNRKHARLKYTIEDMGVNVFREKVEELVGFKFEPPRSYHFDKNVDTFGWQKDEQGKNHFTFFIENGRIEDTADFLMRTGLREIAKLNRGEFRLTGNQHLILSNLADEDKPIVETLMKKYHLDNLQFTGLRLSSSACVAFPTCGLAMAESERYLPVLISKLENCLEENGLSQASIVMRMTGCPNGCARPWLAEVAFVGKAYGAYNMYLGGGYYGQRLNKLYRSSIKEPEILDIMQGLLKQYSLEREQGEHFGDWTIRAGIIKETKEGKYFHDDVADEDAEDEE
ncbi:MAG: hypothetical protein M1834_001537 [Cirrosporium novae-zelandiae]|nr:MAG: hypothetical protein M1834_004054 [Cirrosporium novae-zelandiae]KAI9735522.1 MAG: hypothetical protein M1834_001537 [Cirrosporium novae-zelandiae]